MKEEKLNKNINKEITNYIDTLDYEKDIKVFLKKALDLEYKRDKTKDREYFNEYDSIVKDFM